MTTPAPPDVRLLLQNAAQANKDHQYALRVYSERLEAELEVVDKLLVGPRRTRPQATGRSS